MKILKIRLQNIHSLKGEHEIDFGAGVLAEAGLFAITGPTGSGKSTLLDVITLALYNRIARVDKSISNTVLEDDGGIMTRNMPSCYAEVEYLVNGKGYRSHWSIERNRNNNLNSRKQELVEIATGTIIETGTKTPDKNVEVIGLSYEQFVKAMVLSQGEFSKLLQAPRNERNKLLEDITGARSYRDIGRAVYQRYSRIKKEVELKEAGLESIELLTPETIAAKKAELKSLNESKPEIQKAFQDFNAKINTRKELLAKFKEEKEIEGFKDVLKKRLKDFEADKKRLDEHERLSGYNPDLLEYASSSKDVESIAQQLDGLEKSKSQENLQQRAHLESISKLVKEEVSITNANHELEKFRSRIVSLQAKEVGKRKEAALHQDQMNAYVKKVVQLGYSLPRAETPTQFKTQLDVVQNTVRKGIDVSGLDSMEALNIKLGSLRESNEKALDLLTKKEQALTLQKNIETYKTDLNEGNKKIKTLEKRVKILIDEVPVLNKEVQELSRLLDHQRKHQSLEQHRAQLEPHAPCPLCGSLEHPYASEEPYFDVKEELLNDKKNLLASKSHLIMSLEAENKAQYKDNARLQLEIDKFTAEYTEDKKVLVALAEQLKWNSDDNLENLQSRRNSLSERIKILEESKQAFQANSILKDLQESYHHWELTLQKYQHLKEERTKRYSGNTIDQESNALATCITRSIAKISSIGKQLEDATSKLKSAENQKSRILKKLHGIIESEHLESIEKLQAAILTEEAAHKFRSTNTKLNDGQSRLSEKEKILIKSLKELREKDDEKLSFERLTALFEESKFKWDELSVNIGKITQSLEDDKVTRERQQGVLTQLTLLKKDLVLWKTMNDLIGDANGSKFSNFVQDLTLEQLIGYANKRLSEFSDRYVLDIPTAEEAEKSDTLKIFDRYMGNARRSVRTLSGGETFLVSLAMAFALSDIASRNVKIESLFIDEGFGTLDPETLDQAITILEKMQNEGDKSVGVISHVGALKERITTQIQLDKSSLGYSSVSIVQ
ncbi:exonuclease SbcC [Pricia antarctica]|uniref:Exonuclease SbcC n=1 Tax=Pricia antarctica TaxID=641691 RepID=A0A1G7ADA2_9FLAO|nr:AAA family ATPase [Pricia antarctica]SDE12894.1 exonuclease SbcC [Pricia antarctica]